jgi:hypothetical protein
MAKLNEKTFRYILVSLPKVCILLRKFVFLFKVKKSSAQIKYKIAPDPGTSTSLLSV